MFREYENALVRWGQNFGYILKINRWLIVLVYKRHIQKCAILPNRPQDAEMAGVMSYFFGFQFIVFVPLPTPYFTSDFKNLKNFEKKNTKIFDPFLWFWDGFRQFQNFRKKKFENFGKRFFHDPLGGGSLR